MFLENSAREDSYITVTKQNLKFRVCRSRKQKRAMEYFFEFDSQGELPWFHVAPGVNQSAFVKYTKQPTLGLRSNKGNVNKRMVEFLKKSWTPVIGPVEAERERNHRHMISERMRREKEKRSYSELRNLLPHGTKSDKNSIAQMARKTIEELERYKAELQGKNHELEMALAAAAASGDYNYKQMDEAKINLRIAYPSSGIDSMLEVLKCLKSTGSITKAVHADFSAQEVSAVLQIETKIGAAEVEKAVQTTLFEVERKFRSPFPEE